MSTSASGSLLGCLNGSAAFELPGPARSASRLDLLSLIPSASSDPAQADDILAIISQSGLLAHVPQGETQHKLTVRINSLISSQNALGYRLAHLWIQQDAAIWHDHLVTNALTWATQIVNLLSAPEKLLTQREHSDCLLASALQLAVTHLFPEGITARQEFYRQVVHPNLPKFAVGLTQLLENIVSKQDAEGVTAFGTHLRTVLVFLNRLLHAHSAQFRPVSSRIHECISSLLYRDDALSLPQPIFNAAAAVLSSLHLTGALASKGSDASGGSARTTQTQLWQAIIDSQLHLAFEAWRHATSSYQATDTPQAALDQQEGSTHKHLQPYPKDPLAATKIAHSRLALLLGSRGRSGLINLHLRGATSRSVPIPVGKLITLALDMLRVDLSSRYKPTAEFKVCSLQASFIPTLHTRALALIAQIAITAPAAVPLEASSVLGDICRIAEAGVSGSSDLASNRVKLAAMRTLTVVVGRQGIALPLDPAGRTTLRLARLAAAHVARCVLPPNAPTTTVASGDGRKAKKARLYESDSMFASNIALKDRIQSLGVEEIASTQAALQIIVAVYPLLTTCLSAVHSDQQKLCMHTVLALVEALSDSVSTHSAKLRNASAGSGAPTAVELLQSGMEGLAELCLDSPSSALATVLPRAIPTLGRIAHAPSGSGDAGVRSAAERALALVQVSRKGKFVPVARGVGFGPRTADDFEPAPEGAKLVGAADIGQTISVTGEVQESSLASATTSVLGALGGNRADNRKGDNAEKTTQGEARMDVDTITAESAQLFKAGGADAGSPTDAAQASASPKLGLGLPTSPLRSTMVEKRMFSPDPVKPSHRPATPRIGSPSTSHPPRALSRNASPSPDAVAGGSNSAFLTSGRLSHPDSSPAAVIAVEKAAAAINDNAVAAVAEVVDSPQVAEAVQGVLENVEPAAILPAETTEVTRTEVEMFRRGDIDDDDDEEMPEIDMGDSDDGEEGEGEIEGKGEGEGEGEA
ncbi:uncharacterized protein UBRO2_02825 [Ustilago bromivora]|uniref:Pre-rRNA-processing protein RIX1 N-terminal domain-containing protein n=1 Tax=Ustilago bromivora TaxID=307758 RepID=A0A8H8QLX2_9BASI|nr:uncharacterized protein UBRO2_02825 [Ustilago bromivora]